MPHLANEELVGLVFDELDGGQRSACRAHLRSCPKCSVAFEGLARAVMLLEKEPTEAPPPFAWARLKARLGESEAGRDWAEPAWTPLIFGILGGITLIIFLIILAGGWLETNPLWPAIRTWSVAELIGPRGLAALVFWGAGALVTLALAPILWWEQWRARRNRQTNP